MRRPRLSILAGCAIALGLSLGLGLALPALAQTSAAPVTSGLSAFVADAGFTSQASLTVIIARLIRTFISFLGIIAVGLVIYGGFLYMTAGGDAARLKSAKGVLRNAAIGIAIIIASFAIASYVIGRLDQAVGGTAGITGGGDTGCSTPGCFGDGHADPSHTFAVKDWNQACGGLLQNYQPQLTFTQAVSASVATNGSIQVKDASGTSVPGTFAVQGSLVTFTPASACAAPNAGQHCFGANKTYDVVFDPKTFKSATGATLQCGSGFTACAVSFTTGSAIDAKAPTATMTLPLTGTAVSGSPVPLQVRVQDDVGGSLAQFFAGDASKPIFAAGLANSSVGQIAPDNSFNANPDQWNTAGYAPGSYDVWATASDCAGHAASAAHVTVVLASAQCSNGVKDPGEGDPYDCGPVCGTACAGDPCGTVACAVGLACKGGTCVSTPRIDRVSPGDGAVGNYLTISGAGFGATAGSVWFLGDPKDATDDVQALVPAACAAAWTDTQAIVQIPPNAKSGPLELRAAAYATDSTKADRTDDAFGARLSDFQVNNVVRPGLCGISPVSSDGSVSVSLQGTNFGDARGTTGTVYFGNFTPADYVSWSAAKIGVTSPLLDPRSYDVQVFTGGSVCKLGANDGKACALSTAATDCPGGTCLSDREGSNPLTFTSNPLSQTVPPSIVSVDTGWHACSSASGLKSGAHCAVDGDCGGTAGSCVATPTWGPAGQYVTIAGAHFGSAGLVRFAYKSTAANDPHAGMTAEADVDFPAACGTASLWSDSTAVVKFPLTFSDKDHTPIVPGAYALTVDRAGVDSPSVDVQIVPGAAGPGICRIDPVGGPATTDIKLYGENFGAAGQAIFTPAQNVPATGVVANEADASVPAAAKTGPVLYARTADAFVSNAVNFQVGSCTDKTIVCPVGSQCCSNGGCSTNGCAPAPGPAHYAWMFSTGPVKVAPQVRVACDPKGGVVSPSPWQGWSQPATVCPSALVQAQFDMPMDPSTLVEANVRVQPCTSTDPKDACATLGAALTGKVTSATDMSLDWQQTDASGKIIALDANQTYQVTLIGANIESKEAKNADNAEIGKVPMGADFSWRFTTAADNKACLVGSLMLLDNPFIATLLGQVVPYYAHPISAGDRCVILACQSTYAVAWSNDRPNNVSLPSSATDADGLHCANQATVTSQIIDNTPHSVIGDASDHSAQIEAVLTDTASTTNVKDDARLIVAFEKPKVVEHWPSCDAACTNAQIGARFNVTMNASQLTAPGGVRLFSCTNAVCNVRTEIPLGGTGPSVSYNSTDAAPRLILSGTTGVLVSDTYYQVVISGSVKGLQSGTPLSEFYQGKDYSWIFRTNNTGQKCAIDRIEVDPATATAKVVGERTAFSAVPVSAPDACSADGERLDSVGDGTWGAWHADDQPSATPPTHEIASMLPLSGGVSGALALFPLNGRLPSSCTARCLDAGAPVTSNQAICGNSVPEPGEDCDDGKLNGTAASTCSSTCLRLPQPPAASTCNDASATPIVGTSVSCTAANASQTCANTCTSAGTCSVYGGSCDATHPCKPLTCGISPTAIGCGNGKVEAPEQCDDGPTGSALCTPGCLNTGASGFCGNGKLEPGESCDPAMDPWKSHPGSCTAQCLNAGSIPISQVNGVVCGDGRVEPGEECDDGNTKDGDGCSSRCLNEGAEACVPDPQHKGAFLNAPCCGNGILPEPGKSCDDGVLNGTAGDPCSSACLLLGSSTAYTTKLPTTGSALSADSYCGDGVVGNGEECDAPSSAAAGQVGPFGVSVINDTAVLKVDGKTHLATASVIASAGGKTGAADLSLQCACTTDDSCKTSGAGCGAGSCCFVRPELIGAVPAFTSPIQTNVCRNAAIHLTFSEPMDAASLNPYGVCSNAPTTSCTQDSECGTGNTCQLKSNVTLELLPPSPTPTDETWCTGAGGSLALREPQPSGFFARLLAQVKQFLAPFARAQVAGTHCLVPVSFGLDTITTDGNVTGGVVNVNIKSLLASGGTYRVVVQEAPDSGAAAKVGILSANQVTIDGSKANTPDGLSAGSVVATQFTVGSDICVISKINVTDQGKTPAVAPPEDPSVGLFTKTGETHKLVAEALAMHNGQLEQIQRIAGVYDWRWDWQSNIDDANETKDPKNVVSVAAVAGTPMDAVATADKTNGQETVIAETSVTAPDASNKNPAPLPAFGTKVSGEIVLSALLCQNPAKIKQNGTLIPQPYVNTNSNYSFFYCLDAGDPNTTADDLPDLTAADTGARSFGGIKFDTLFTLDGTHDALGVRVVPNPTYLSPEAWYAAQGFRGSPTPTTVDGYPALQDGGTWYVAAPNENDAHVIYPNIYVISANADAQPASMQAFQQILSTWSFNANRAQVTDYNLCRVKSDASLVLVKGKVVSCGWDGDCADTCTVQGTFCDEKGDAAKRHGACSKDADCGTGGSCVAGTSCSISGAFCDAANPCLLAPTAPTAAYCDAQKAKLRRDSRRLSDLVGLRATLDQYGTAARHCSITKTQACSTDAQCGTGETCVATVPALAAGTFIRTEAVSAWPSWSSALGNALGVALPTDPLNAFYACGASRCSTSGAACASNADCATGQVCQAGVDTSTCFDGANATFYCPVGSHVYGFKSVGGESYTLYGQLEEGQQPGANAVWFDPIDSGTGQIHVEGATDTVTPLPTGFSSSATPSFCGGSVIGTSTVCGDGVKSVNETCELGEIKSPAPSCVTLDGTKGTLNVPCGIASNGQCGWNTSKAVCVPFDCGNGIPEGTEACDHGAKNGTYGDRCSTTCHISDGPSDSTNGPTTFCGDGYLSAGEQCDCGNDQLFSSVTADPKSWASTHACGAANGVYVKDPTKTSCTSDCKLPGPSCGDGIVQTDQGEQCEGNQTQDVPDRSCVASTVCEKGDPAKLGKICSSSDPAFCNTSGKTDGKCSVSLYPTAKLQVCVATTCRYAAPTADCRATTLPSCGNGIKEGNEECDDGNTNNNDTCTNDCKINVCGDGIPGIDPNGFKEACDAGDVNHGGGNGKPCTAAYGGTCGYCDNSCRLQTLTGGQCGDGKINGQEVCDGADVPWSCVYEKDGKKRSGSCKNGATCPAISFCSGGPTNGAVCTADADCGTGGTCSGASVPQTCELAGVCNGGPTNGAVCTANSDCGSNGSCAFPTCAADCGVGTNSIGSCPFNYASIPLKVTPAIANGTPQDSVTLYSSTTGNTPSGGQLQIPGCLAGSSLIADVDDSKLVRPNLDIVFVTDVSIGGSGEMANVQAGLKETAQELFADYPAGKLKIGLVSFGYAPSSATGVDKNGVKTDTPLIGDLSTVWGDIAKYPQTTGPADIYDGVKAGTDMLSTTAEKDAVHVLVLTSAGIPGVKNLCIDPNDLGTDCSNTNGSADDSKCLKPTDNTCNASGCKTNPFTGVTDFSTCRYSCNLSGVACHPSVLQSSSSSVDCHVCTSQPDAGIGFNYQSSHTDAVNGLIATHDPSIHFYTVAVTSNSQYIGAVNHMSSDVCGTNWSDPSPSQCKPDANGVEYAYHATSADGIVAQDTAITKSVIGSTISYGISVKKVLPDGTVTEVSTYSSGAILSGRQTLLPFPKGFTCQPSPSIVAFSSTFTGVDSTLVAGSGQIIFGNFKLQYCPLP